MTKLADKIEALEGPSREADAEIYWEVNGFPSIKYSRAMGLRPKGTKQPTEMEWLAASNLPPACTASLDAAMTLVPEGWFEDFVLETLDDGRWLCRLGDGDTKEVFAKADTPALAQGAAALRAREANR